MASRYRETQSEPAPDAGKQWQQKLLEKEKQMKKKSVRIEVRRNVLGQFVSTKVRSRRKVYLTVVRVWRDVKTGRFTTAPQVSQ